MQVITAGHSEWIFPFTGLQPVQFRKLVRLVAERGGDAIADGRPGRQWALDLADRVLLVADLLAHQPDHAPDRPAVRGIALRRAPGHRHPRPAPGARAGAPAAGRPDRHRRRHPDSRLGTTALAARSKNYRYSTNLQVAIDASTRLVIAVGDPQPGNRRTTRSSTAAPASRRSWTGGRSWPTAATAATPR